MFNRGFMAFGMFLYSIYNLAKGKISTALLSFAVCLIFAYFFRKYYNKHVEPIVKVHSKLAEMHTLSGEEFEEFVGKYLMELGYIIQATPKTGDGGIDFHAWRNDGAEYAVVQCKNWSSPVGAREVRELYGTMMANKANRAILITSSDFTRQAREFAMLCDELVLISGETLIQTLRKSA